MASVRSWLPKVAALGLALTVSAGMIEVLVRAAGLDAPLVWRPDPVLGWWHVPGAAMHWTDEGDGQVRINGQGLRDVDRSVSKPAGVYRIAVFGDSMTEGVQVNLDQTYTQLLESRLRQQGLKVEVLNFGVNGYSPLQDFLLYQRVGKAYSPDLVVLAAFLDNDIADGRLDLATDQSGGPRLAPDEPWTIDFSGAESSTLDYRREPKHTLREWFATYRFATKARNRRMLENNAKVAASAGGGVPKRFQLYADPLTPPWLDAWKLFDRIVVRFEAEVRGDGHQFALLSVPAGQVVDPQAWNDLLVRFPAMAGRPWRPEDAEERVQQLAAQRGVKLVAPFREFRQEIHGGPLFFGGIGHFTPRGHAVMAAALERDMRRLALLPQ